MKPFFNERHEQLAARAGKVARELESVPPDDLRQMVRRLGDAFAAELTRAEATSLCIIREALAERSALFDTLFGVQGLGSYPITLAGGPRELVAELAAGRKLAAFALTEPEAGSDVAAMQTTARRDGTSYVLDGHKAFISNAELADAYTVFARTGEKSISAFVVERGAAGLSTRPQKLTSQDPVAEVHLSGVRASLRLGAEGDGLKLAFGTLDVFRPTVGAAACGMARRALDETLARVRARVQFGRPIGEFQATRFKLADMATELDAARLLVYRAAAAHDRGERAKRESSMAKLFATEAAQRIVDQAVQLHGGAGLLLGSPTERLYRDIRALRIYEGTSEIQRMVIARDLLG